MIYPHLDPVLVHLGPVSVRWYALAYIAGILIGWRYGVALAKNVGLWRGAQPTANEQQIDDLVLWLTLAILIGGRVGSILFYNPTMIWQDPLQMFKVWDGGMSFHGAFLAVAGVIVWFSRRHHIDMLRLGDLVAPCVPFGLFFGRLANYNNGELWGRPTHSSFGLIFPNADYQLRYPSQLFEAGLEGVVLFLILRVATHHLKWLPRRGANTGLFILFYGLFRIALENVREPDRNMPNFPLGLTMGMMLSIPMVLIGVWLIWLSRKPGALAAPVGALPADPSQDGTPPDVPELNADTFAAGDYADESHR